MSAPYYPRGGSRERLHRRPTSMGPSPTSPFQYSSHGWDDGGVQYKVQTASYTAPSFSLGVFGGSARGGFSELRSGDSHSVQGQSSSGFDTARGGLIDTAFSVLGGNRPPLETASSTTTRRHPSRRPQVEVEVIEGDTPELADREEVEFVRVPSNGRNRKPSVFSRLKGKLQDNTPRRQKAPSPEFTRSSSHRSQRSARGYARHRDGNRNRSDSVTEEHIYRNGYDYRPASSDSYVSDQAIIETLENTVDYHRREVKLYKKHLERATQLSSIDSGYIQHLLDELKDQENAHLNATIDLKRAKEDLWGPSSGGPYQGFRQPRRSHTSPIVYEEYEYSPRDDDPGAFLFEEERYEHSPIFDEFDEFDAFHDFHSPRSGYYETSRRSDPFEFFSPVSFFMQGVPFGGSRRRQRFSRGSRTPHSAGVSPTSPGPSYERPSAMLTHEETTQLFQVYNNRWNVLSPADSDIPYPARDLKAQALTACDTIWAPTGHSNPATWSEETIMQANVQAFFITAMGLHPTYTDGPTGSIEMGFDQHDAPPEKISELIDVLKKEKMRWHSDRLGRRHGGTGGINEALQSDNRARAVFHAVVGLMETAQAAQKDFA